MDAKLTPEQAIDILRQDVIDYSPVSKFVKPISRGRAEQIAALIESLARDAELGRAAVEAMNKIDRCNGSTPCIPEGQRFYKGNDHLVCRGFCKWEHFCRLRAGKEAE